MASKHYALTEVGGERVAKVVDGFGEVSELIGAGLSVKFRPFPTRESALRYLETGCSFCPGHSRRARSADAIRARGIGSLTATPEKTRKRRR